MTPEEIKQAAYMRASGSSLREIAANYGVSKQAIDYHFQKDHTKRIIKEAQKYFIDTSLIDAVENQARKIKTSKKIMDSIENNEKIPAGAVKLLELGHDSEKQLLQSVGIHNAHTQSIQVNNILIDNRQELSPAIESMLTRHLLESGKVEGKEGQGQIIDAEMVQE